jgi:hypothetical protein
LANRAIDSKVPFGQEEGFLDDQATQEFLRKSAQDAIVLLKNESSLLPLGGGKQRKIAVIGPNAKLQIVTGGGSASLRAIRSSSPLEGILEAAEKDAAEVHYTPGIFAHKYLPLVDPLINSPRKGKGYLDLAFFAEDPKNSTEQEPIHTVDVDTANNFMVSRGNGREKRVSLKFLDLAVRQPTVSSACPMLHARHDRVYARCDWGVGVWSRGSVSLDDIPLLALC